MSFIGYCVVEEIYGLCFLTRHIDVIPKCYTQLQGNQLLLFEIIFTYIFDT